MKHLYAQTVLLYALFTIFVAGQTTIAKPHTRLNSKPKPLSQNQKTDRNERIKTLPILFEENRGQFAQSTKYFSRGNGFNLLLASDQAIYQIPDPTCRPRRGRANFGQGVRCKAVSLTMKVLDANPEAAIQGTDASVTKSSYAIGNDESKWFNNVPNYHLVEYRNIYQGVNLVFRGTEHNLEYDFRLAPDADPKLIQLKFEGAKKLQIDAAGNLVFKMKGVALNHRKPFAYQMVGGEKVAVDVSFAPLGHNRVGFRVGTYDRSRELIIDPIVYASYLGYSTGGDSVNDIAVDLQGNIYTASDFRYSITENNVTYTYSDVMISKFNPDGTERLWVKVVGGSQDDVPYGLDVDGSGRVYVTGVTYSPNFPLAFPEQTSHPINIIGSDFTGYVLRLDDDGEISYSTYLGGSTPAQYGQSIVADSEANAYVTGFTCSSTFPVRNGFQNSLQGTCNSFLTKFDSNGQIAYSTFFGGNNSIGADVFTDGTGNAYVAGGAGSGVFTTAGAYSLIGDGFVAKFDTTRSGSNSLVYSTRVPKSGAAIAVDPGGNAWVAMSLSGFVTGQSAQVLRLNNLGSGLLVEAQTFGTQIRDIAVDSNGSAYFAYNLSGANRIASKVTALRPNGEEIDSFTIDATRDEKVYGITLGPEADTVYVGGSTTSLNFPTTIGAYQPTSNAPNIFFGQGFFAKVQLNILSEREPLIFIPGVSGSWLDAVESDGSRTNLWLGLLQNHDRLTLDPNQEQANIIATDAIRAISIPVPIPGTFPQQFYFYPKDAYRQILERLTNQEHYVEYQVNGQPARRTFDGCDVSGQMATRPNLFVFAYDWRKSNIENAQALREYVGCVRRFYPTSKVNILAHSMGGLLARRYVISNPNDHHVDKLVTIGSPWLGAPKAIEVLETGNFGLSPVVWNSTIRRLGEFFKGMHELLPSRTYFDAATRTDFHLTNYGKPLKEEGWDANGNGIDFEDYDYDKMVRLLNEQQPRSNPGSANQLLHDTPGQDNWLADASGVEYLHIYGQQSYLNTTVQVIAKYRMKCRLFVCRRENYYDVVRGRGDRTVPTISAERSFGPYYDLFPRNDKPFFSSNRSQDNLVEHTSLTQNPTVQQDAINFLNSESPQLAIAVSQSSKGRSANSTQSLLEPGAESIELPLREGYYVNISGVNYVEIRDDLGNVNTPLEAGYLLPVPSVNYDLTSEKSIAITTPTEGSYTLTFRSGDDPIFLETIKGMGNLDPTEAVRYLDLNLPQNVNAQFQVLSTGITDLRYDSDGDGSFETLVLPTSRVTGNAANDLAPPTIQINEIVQPSRQLVINASDTNSGVRRIYYSFDGTDFGEYAGPIPLTQSQSGTIYTFADDNSSNRSLIATYTFVPVPNPVVAITSPMSGSVFPIGTSVSFAGNFGGDNCNAHTAVWTFDNTSHAGTVDESNGTVTTNYTFTSTGVYVVSLTVDNSCGGVGSAATVNDLQAMVVIYDPNGGFVTGGGWIDSPLGAFAPNPNLTGRASFGFTSRYQRGATIPTGNTEFQFRVAELNFKSASYDWLVVGGAKAQYKGSGTINGNGNYGFILTAIDEQINGGGGVDKFRIKIWDKSGGNVIYDNQIGTPDGTTPTTAIGGGSIIIHRR